MLLCIHRSLKIRKLRRKQAIIAKAKQKILRITKSEQHKHHRDNDGKGKGGASLLDRMKQNGLLQKPSHSKPGLRDSNKVNRIKSNFVGMLMRRQRGQDKPERTCKDGQPAPRCADYTGIYSLMDSVLQEENTNHQRIELEQGNVALFPPSLPYPQPYLTRLISSWFIFSLLISFKLK